jgi:hypothetical protein
MGSAGRVVGLASGAVFIVGTFLKYVDDQAGLVGPGVGSEVRQ